MSSGAVGKAVSNIHNNTKKCLAYIVNPEKTDRQLLISGVNCLSPEDSVKTAEEFEKIHERYSKENSSIMAHHYLISFDPKDNVAPEKAHELSREIMDRFLKGKYQAVLSTHVDKESHIHTHAVFNTFDVNGNKYESSPDKLREFKKVINEVCLEHNLQPINKPNDKSINLSYKKWLDKQCSKDKNTERFEYIKHAVKSILKDGRVKNLEQLSKELKEKYGINTKYKNLKTGTLYKNITFKCDEWNKGIRGKYDISLENILKQLEGREVESNKYQEFCIKNNTESYKEYIKNAIDTLLETNSINSVDELSKALKHEYNIEMKYLASNGTYLNRFKYKALDSKQKNYIGSASLDRENREVYELKGLKKRIAPDMKFSDDIRENLKILNKKVLLSEKEDRWNLRVSLDYLTKKNLRTRSDIDIRRNKINLLKQDNELRIQSLKKYTDSMMDTYSNIKKKMIEVDATAKELDELGILKIKQKKELSEKIDKLNNDIKELKNSEFYQKDMKYSQKMDELSKDIETSREKMNEYNEELNLMYYAEYADQNKERIQRQIEMDKENEQEQKREQELERKLLNRDKGLDF